MMFRFTSWLLVIGVIGAAHSFAQDQEPPNADHLEKLKEKLEKGGPVTWRKVVKDVSEQQLVVTKVLAQRGLDTELEPDDRRAAIKLIATVGSPSGVKFLLENLHLRIPIGDLSGFKDVVKMYPCQVALEELGWKVIPEILTKAQASRNEEDAHPLARLLIAICGRELAFEIVTERVKRKEVSPKDTADVLRKVHSFLKP